MSKGNEKSPHKMECGYCGKPLKFTTKRDILIHAACRKKRAKENKKFFEWDLD